MKVFSMRHMGLMSLIGLSIFLLQLVRADISAELAEASAPLAEGVPEVAVARLQALLNKNLPDPDWRAVIEKLGEAQLAARQPGKVVVFLADSRLRDARWATFWRALSYGRLHRWANASPRYVQLGEEL